MVETGMAQTASPKQFIWAQDRGISGASGFGGSARAKPVIGITGACIRKQGVLRD